MIKYIHKMDKYMRKMVQYTAQFIMHLLKCMYL